MRRSRRSCRARAGTRHRAAPPLARNSAPAQSQLVGKFAIEVCGAYQPRCWSRGAERLACLLRGSSAPAPSSSHGRTAWAPRAWSRRAAGHSGPEQWQGRPWLLSGLPRESLPWPLSSSCASRGTAVQLNHGQEDHGVEAGPGANRRSRFFWHSHCRHHGTSGGLPKGFLP